MVHVAIRYLVPDPNEMLWDATGREAIPRMGNAWAKARVTRNEKKWRTLEREADVEPGPKPVGRMLCEIARDDITGFSES